MTDAVDVASPLGQSLASTMKAAILDTTHLGVVGLGGLALDGYEDLLLSMAAVALFPTLTSDLDQAPDCGSDVIRQARDYIRGHAAEVIELSLLAQMLGVSMRAMQLGFQRYFGYSPRDYIIECRLQWRAK
jgi:hypothetical protein